MTACIAHLVLGPHRHGVARFGLELQDALRANGFDVALVRSARDLAAAEHDGVHIQFTDRLFGSDALAAAAAFSDIAGAVRAGGARVTATLHDLPQPSDGVNHERRRAAYGAVAAACDAIVVSSEHERELLFDNGIDAHAVVVVPLPIRRCDVDTARPTPRSPSLGVFGFLYPGKGHDDVIRAASCLPPEVDVVAIGEPSAGHDDLVAELEGIAARQGRRFRVTGHVADAALTTTLREVTVPVAAHRHVSASGSLNTWLAAGRRPLAPANRYTAEIVRRNPGSVAVYDDSPQALERAIVEALAHPDTTWLTADTEVGPSPSAAAAAYAAFFEQRS